MADRYDPKPLIEAMAPHSLRWIARRLDVDPAVLCRPLTLNQADRYTMLLDLRPDAVWGKDWARPDRVK